MSKKKIAHKKPERPIWPSLNAPRVFPDCALLEAREALGLKQKEAAAIIGMAASNLWKLEQGTDVKLSYARKIAKAYGKEIEDLWPPQRFASE